jgi:hypothetical protein
MPSLARRAGFDDPASASSKSLQLHSRQRLKPAADDDVGQLCDVAEITAARPGAGVLGTVRSLPAAARCSVWFGGLRPEAGDQPTGLPDVALVVLAEPFPEELLLRGRLNEYPDGH